MKRFIAFNLIWFVLTLVGNAEAQIRFKKAQQNASTAYIDDTQTISGLLTFSADATFNDNVKVTLGTGGDADIYYDGTNVIIDPDVVGSGLVGINETSPGAQLDVTSRANGTIALIVDTAGTPTVNTQQWQRAGVIYTYVNTSGSLHQLVMNSINLGNDVNGPALGIGRNANPSSEGGAAGTVAFTDAAGSNTNYIWVDNSGNARTHTSAPTGSTGSPTVSDTAGTVIGTQTSWHALKQNITPFNANQRALDAIVKTPLYSYDMQGRHYDAGYVIFPEDLRSWFSWNDDLSREQVPTLNQRQILGYFAAAIKALDAKVTRLERARTP